MITLSPDEDAIFTALRAFLVAVVPGGTDSPPTCEVIVGQQNRVGEPPAGDFVVMWPISRPRLATNVDEAVDTSFQASIAATVMTVTTVGQGALTAGAQVFATGIADGTKIVNQLTGPAGGAGTYAIDPTQTLGARGMACGQTNITQETEIVVQCDVHSASLFTAGDIAARIATTFRDAYAAGIIAASNAKVSPLFADDPRQLPFINAEQQYETRWTVDLHLQSDQTYAGIPQQFAAILALDLVSVDAAYPPG